jgi:TonB family protein
VTSFGRNAAPTPNSPDSEQPKDIATAARTLAAYGSGALGFDLALDLLLNEAVEEVCSATGATGAAIALSRNGAMQCRATTGEHAPDLGVRVETESGLSGACLRSGEIQNCSDTEIDPRVDAAACRQLGVRSMLVMPLRDGSGPFGILEVLSSRPSAFSERDVETLRSLAKRIVAAKRETEGAMHPLVSVEEDSQVEASIGVRDENDERSPDPLARPEVELGRSTRNELWTTALIVLIVVAAVALGVVIGWRSAAKKWVSEPQHGIKPHPVQPIISVPASPSPVQSAAASTQVPSDTSRVTAAPAKAAPQVSGLVVTENGKVIFREPSNVSGDKGSTTSARLVHRVEPEYPDEARARNLEGAVILDVQVLPDGAVGTIGIVSGDAVLARAAVHAIRQWKYQPNYVNGRPVEGQTRITINFTLPN